MSSQFVWSLDLRVINPRGPRGHSEAADSTQNVQGQGYSMKNTTEANLIKVIS